MSKDEIKTKKMSKKKYQPVLTSQTCDPSHYTKAP
jgi:hypothetical protein